MSLATLVRGHFQALVRGAPRWFGSARPISNPTMTVAAPNGDRSNLIPFSSRLLEGRALAQDVWSIFKCVHFKALTSPQLHLSAALQISPPTALILARDI